jgi:hypothetical protein
MRTKLLFLSLISLALLASPRPVAHAQAGIAGGAYKYISTATTTTVKNGNGYLSILSVNGGTAGTVSLYDIASSGCTGTPASGKFAAITVSGTFQPVSMFYELNFGNGLCVVTSAATDVTVAFN